MRFKTSFFNGHWRPTKTVAAEMKSTGGNWFFCSFGEKQSGSWKKKKKKEQSQQGGFWFMPLFAHPQILFWVGISHVSGGTLCSFQFCETPRAGRSSWRLVGIFSFIETNAVMGEVWTQFYFVFQRGFVCANLTSWTVLQIPVGWYLWYWCIVPTINDAVIEPNTKSVVLNWVLVSAVSF